MLDKSPPIYEVFIVLGTFVFSLLLGGLKQALFSVPVSIVIIFFCKWLYSLYSKYEQEEKEKNQKYLEELAKEYAKNQRKLNEIKCKEEKEKAKFLENNPKEKMIDEIRKDVENINCKIMQLARLYLVEVEVSSISMTEIGSSKTSIVTLEFMKIEKF